VKTKLLLSVVWLLPLAGCHREPAVGAVLYQARCAFCHGVEGRGDGTSAPTMEPPPTNFRSPEYWAKATPEGMRKAIVHGVPHSTMTSYQDSLTEAQLAALLAYLEEFRPSAAR
jgi:mono/diheme cytochrome c family protein